MLRAKITNIVLFLFFISFSSIHSQEDISKEKTKADSSGMQQAEVFLGLLQKHFTNGAYQLHKNYSDSLLSVAKKYDLTKMQVIALTNQAVFYNNRSERLKAIELYQKALEQCELIPEDYKSKTVVLVNMGNTYNNIGSYSKAIEVMKKVLIVTNSAPNSNNIKAAALIGLASSSLKLKDYKSTLEYAHRAKIIGEKSKNERTVASALNSIIDAHIKLKEYEEALIICETAIKLPYIKKPTKARAWLLLNFGIVNYHLNSQEVSIEHLKASIELAREKKMLEIEMHGHEYLAKVYEARKDFKASYASQKNYSLISDEFLKDKKDATSADLNNDIAKKNKTIETNNEQFITLVSNKKQLIIWGGTLLALLIGMLLFYIKRKKNIELEQTKLRAQYVTLQQRLEVQNHESEPTKVDHLKPYKNSSLKAEDIDRYKRKILIFMNEEEPFLNPELNQSELASQIGISSHHFSEVLHYGFEQNFYNFINSYRVLAAQKLMKNEKYKDAKIIAIAFDSGFKSKTSFNRVFKKYTGLTPSDYRNTN